MRIAVVGATGLVGSKMLQVLEEKNFPVTELFPVASAKSIGKKVNYGGNEYSVIWIPHLLVQSRSTHFRRNSLFYQYSWQMQQGKVR